MKKYISFLLMLIVPSMCFGASARYTQLVRLKKQKMEQLEKCMGTSKGLQIAGISTLGLTAAGVAGNIYEAKIIKDNEKTLEKQKTTLEEKKAEYNKKQAKYQEEQAKKETASGATEKGSENTVADIKTVVEKDIQIISAAEVKIGTQAITHGYRPGQLPTDLKGKLASPLEEFSKKCKSLEGKEGIASVQMWKNPNADDATGAYEDETKSLQNIGDFVVLECRLDKCEAKTHIKRGDTCIEKSSDCTDTAKAKDSNVVLAVKNGNRCEIQQCSGDFKPSDDKSRCEEKKKEEPQKKLLTDDEKLHCQERVFKSFKTGIPTEYQALYNTELDRLRNKVADRDGVLEYNANGFMVKCKKGQMYKDCDGAERGLPALTKQYVLGYAEEQQCQTKNTVTLDIGITEDETQSCTGDKVWVPSVRECQDPKTAEESIEFDRKSKECLKNGASGYSKDRGCLCADELTHEYDGKKCVPINKEAKKKCSDSGGNWENAKCKCPADQLEVSGECIDGYNENKIKCIGLGGDWVDDSCENLDNANLSDEDACFFEGGYFKDGKCKCPGSDETFNPNTKICELSDDLKAGGAPYYQPTEVQQMLDAPQMAEKQPVVLPDRSATSYFVH